MGGSTLAADPFGRVRVSWFRLIDGRPAIWLRRARTGAAGFRQVKEIALPKGTQNVFKVYLRPRARKVDVVALLNLHGKDTYWTTQITPPKQ